MNFKERLTSTEKLLRSIRSGEASPPVSAKAEAPPPRTGSVWTRPITVRDLFSGLARRASATKAAPPPAPPAQGGPAQAAPAQSAAKEQSPRAPAARAAAPNAESLAPPGAASGPTPAQHPPEAAAPAAPAVGAALAGNSPRPFWSRQLRLRGGKAYGVGVSVCGGSLCLAAVRRPGGAVVAARRLPMGPDQAPGEKGFALLLRSGLEALGVPPSGADIWAVLRSSDQDLNMLAVPRLSGAKLDAAVYWTLQKEKKFAEADYALDYLPLGPAQGDARLEVLTCLARKADVDRLREAFEEAGLPLAGVTAIPNAFMALYRAPGAPAGGQLAANIHVEPDFSAIGLYAKDRLVFSRFIRSGAGSMAEALVEHFQALARPRPAPQDDLELPLPGAAPSAGAGPQGAAAPAEPPRAIDAEEALELLRHVLLGAARPAWAGPEHLLSPEAMLQAVNPAIERLARQVERTLEYYATSQQARCDALHLSGEIFVCPAVAQALAAQLGFQPQGFDAAAILGADAGAIPAAERMTLAPALAAALAQPGRGINLAANYKVRTAQEAKNLVTRAIVMGLAAVMLFIGGAGFLLERANAARRAEIEDIKVRSAALGPLADDAVLSQRVAMFKLRQEALRTADQRLLALAAVAELSQRLPEGVRLLALSVDYPAQAGGAAAKAPAQQSAQPSAAAGQGPAQGSLAMEGMVLGGQERFDATLSRFVIGLQGSPMLHMPVVKESGLRELGSGETVLHFVIHVGVR